MNKHKEGPLSDLAERWKTQSTNWFPPGEKLMLAKHSEELTSALEQSPLIAAAPEMKEELERVIQMMDIGDNCPETRQRIRSLLARIDTPDSEDSD